MQQSDALEALAGRARDVADRARALLDAGDGTDPVCTEAVGSRLAGVSAQLHEVLRGPLALDGAQAAALCEALAELSELHRELREHAIELRFGSLAHIYEGLARLRERPTIAELLNAAPQELCRCCGFDRAIVSRVQGATWKAEVVYIAPGQDEAISEQTRDFLLGTSIPLEPDMLETQLVRRRTAALVADPVGDPRIHQPLVTASQTLGYVVAPIMPTGRVIGFLHADCHGSRRALSELDRDNVWTFAESFGLIFERLVLFERLGEQRAAAREAFEQAERELDELHGAEVKLARHEREASGATASAAAALFAAPLTRVERLLTDREREVMTLMVAGARNSEIADQLVITQDTVKSHVKKILRKLRASSRAEAVSRYLQLTIREQL